MLTSRGECGILCRHRDERANKKICTLTTEENITTSILLSEHAVPAAFFELFREREASDLHER
ncbi:hypothetical protein KSX_17260 [Ktedonospora formicarum]|uniref:Uncharacterized protein n=1 Tax=Ktedonospora formicarum TaxID=2778364 RepID=A0A8J3HZX1_9CHLR|nr:hypothetical protein KSX_17260 [Ktedonospora formicarum]